MFLCFPKNPLKFPPSEMNKIIKNLHSKMPLYCFHANNNVNFWTCYILLKSTFDLPILLMAVTQNPYRRPVGELQKNRNINAMILYFLYKFCGNITNRKILDHHWNRKCRISHTITMERSLRHYLFKYIKIGFTGLCNTKREVWTNTLQ